MEMERRDLSNNGLSRKHYLYSGTGGIMETKLERIADKSRNEKRLIFTSLYHLINERLLK